jgi:pimeloyl-ACP methyl ester carboxylesterase
LTVIPSVQYAKNGDFTLAYQVVGTGPKDLIYLPMETPNVVGNWFIPEHARFIERLTTFSRLVITDRRGMGCSDRLPPGQAPTLEELVDDLLVVMETANAAPAVLFAASETAFIAMLAAATHPDRFERLILWSASPSWHWSDDLPWEPRADAVDASLGSIRRVTNLRSWAERFTRDYAPSWSGDEEKIAVMEALSALAGTVEAWYQDQRMFSELDLRDLLPSIRVPTLVLCRRGTKALPVESSRFIAERMPEAKLVELDGADAFPWIGDADAVLDEIQEFMTGERRTPDPGRALATVLFTDIVDSTGHAAELGDAEWLGVLEQHDARVREELAAHDGIEVDTAGDGFFATFDGPARAVRCARAIGERIRELGLEVRAGVHTGEVERAGRQVRGLAVHIGARVGAYAGANEVLVTSTVKDLAAGSGLTFEDAGEHELKGVPGTWRLYRVSSAIP